MLAISGCKPSPKSSGGVIAPEQPRKEMVEVGDTYGDVIDLLGKPNIDSVSKGSTVMIYDEIEIKLVNDVVTEVFDHR